MQPEVDRRRANLEEPKSFDEAQGRLIHVQSKIGQLTQLLAEPELAVMEINGMETNEEYFLWRRRVFGARSWFEKERLLLESWLAQYERDRKAEEQAEEQARKAAGKARRLAEERRRALDNQARAQKAREENLQRLIEAKGKAASYNSLAQIEAQIIRTQRQIEEYRRQEEARERKARHKANLAALASDEPIILGDPENLLRHAVRLLDRLYKEGRATYSRDEQVLINACREVEKDRSAAPRFPVESQP